MIKIKNLSTRKHLSLELPQHSIGCEMGVRAGDHAKILLDGSIPKRLHLVDYWTSSPLKPKPDWARHKRTVVRKFAKEISTGQIILHDGFVESIMPMLEPLDWVYIDTFHSYSAIIRDLNLAYDAVKPGGYISGHDFCVYNEPEKYGTSVVRAVIEFIQSGRGSMIAITNERFADYLMVRL